MRLRKNRTLPRKVTVINRREVKGSSGYNRKHKTGKGSRRLPTDEMIQELREELRLIDRTIAALIRLFKLRQ
jgi:hypothetical protein